MAITASRGIAVERVGIIGAGSAAAAHLHALRRLQGKRVVAIFDPNDERASALAAGFGLPPSVVMGREHFYDHGRPQLVHVVTPPHVHQDIGFDALARKVHVLVEKPPALTLEGCRLLERQAKCGGVTIGVNENTALEPLVLRARHAIAAGRVGQLLHIDGFYSFGISADQRPPNWMDRLPGGMLEDLLPHPLTIARALTGGGLTVEHWNLVSTGRVAGQRHDLMRLSLTKNRRLTINLTVSLTGRPKSLSFVLRGTQGVLAMDLRDMLFTVVFGLGGPVARYLRLFRASLGTLCQMGANTAGLLSGYRERYGSSLSSIRAHYAALEAGREVPAPLSRAIETVEIIRKIWPI
jgi:predicted dehydrogenase